MTYHPTTIALLLVDPYHDFLSEGGKVWPRAKAIAEEMKLLDHLRGLVRLARDTGIKVYFVPPPSLGTRGLREMGPPPRPTNSPEPSDRPLPRATWGGTFHDDFQPQPNDIVVHELWHSSGFANTDLDMQLKQFGISHVILVGMIAHTCIEATGRFATELGYHVTLVKDATDDFSAEAMHAAHAINGPTYAHAITTTDELIAELTGGVEARRS